MRVLICYSSISALQNGEILVKKFEKMSIPAQPSRVVEKIRQKQRIVAFEDSKFYEDVVLDN